MRDYKQAAKIFKAFNDEKRLRILDMISGDDMCACDILGNLQISQPTLSHHMKILRESGIVKARESGKWMHYSIDKEELHKAMNLLQSFIR